MIMTCYVGQDFNYSAANVEKLSNVEFAEEFLENNSFEDYMTGLRMVARQTSNTLKGIIARGRIGFTSGDVERLSTFRDRLYAMLLVLEEDNQLSRLMDNYSHTWQTVQNTIDYLKENAEKITSWNPEVGDMAFTKWKQGYKLFRGETGTLISPEGMEYTASDIASGVLTKPGIPGWLLPAAIGGAALFFVMR